MPKFVKRLLIVVAALVLLLGVALLIVVLSINSIAKGVIEKSGTNALGVPTRVDSISIGLLSGTAEMNGLNIANPANYDFRTAQFLKMGHSKVAVSIGSVLSGDTITLPELVIENLNVQLEKNAKGSNFGVILDNLKAKQGPADPNKKPDDSGGEGKKFIIENLRLRNITVGADLAGGLPIPGGDIINKATHVDIQLDEITLSNVGKTGSGVGGSGVTAGQLTAIITQAILSAAANKGGGLLPPGMAGDLQKGLTDLKGLGSMGIVVAEGGAKVLQEVGKEAVNKVGQETQKVGDKLGEGVKGVEDKIKDVIPGLPQLPGQKPKEEPK